MNSLYYCSDLQKDLYAVLDWSSKWLLHLNPEKYTALSITNKRYSIMHTYQLNGHPIIWPPVVRYLGIYLIFPTKRASNTLNYVMLCIHESKVYPLAFKYLVWLQLEYACQVWNSHLVKDIQMFKAIEKHAARWIHAKWNHDTYTWYTLLAKPC